MEGMQAQALDQRSGTFRFSILQPKNSSIRELMLPTRPLRRLLFCILIRGELRHEIVNYT